MRPATAFIPGSERRLGVRARGLAALVALCCALGTPRVAHALIISCLGASVTATGPAFGTYVPNNIAATNSNGSVSVTCFIATAILASASVSVTLSAGASGTFSTRTMLSGANALKYNLFADNAYTQIWGDGTSGTTAVTDNFSFILTGGLLQTVNTPIYGQIPALQLNVFPGSYSDTIIVTINY
jgi:spore coat protein U-like protein